MVKHENTSMYLFLKLNFRYTFDVVKKDKQKNAQVTNDNIEFQYYFIRWYV